MNHFLSWPPQPSTLIAFATMLGGIVWYFTGSADLAGLVGVLAAALLPDNTGVGGQIAAGVNAIEKVVKPRGGGLQPPPPPPPPVAAFLALLLTGVMLTACAGGAANEGVKVATVAGQASAALLPPSAAQKVASTCVAAGPMLAVASSPGLPAAVSETASYGDAYCRQLVATGQLPPTTDSNTVSWLPTVISGVQTAAQLAGVILPIVAAL